MAAAEGGGAEDGLLLAAAALARLLRSEKERKVRSGELFVSRLAEVASGSVLAPRERDLGPE